MPRHTGAARWATGAVITAAAAAAPSLFHPAVSHAVTYSWTGAGGNATFSNPVNWSRSDNVPPTTGPLGGDTALFSLPSTYSVVFTGPSSSDTLNLTNPFANVTFSSSGGQKTYTVTGAGGQVSLSGGSLSLGAAAAPMTITATNFVMSGAATLNSKFGSDLNITNLQIGTSSLDPSTASATLDGVGTTLSTTGITTIGASTATGVLTLTNLAFASFSAAVNLGDDTGVGSLVLSSNATATSSAAVNVGTLAATTGRGSLALSSGATLTLTGTAPLNLGSSAGPTSTLSVNGATLKTSTATSTINPTGLLTTATSASFQLNGDLLVAGTAVFAPNTLVWAPGKAVTVSAGGALTLTGPYAIPATASLHVTGGTLTASPVTPGDNATLALGPSASADITGGGTANLPTLAIGNNNTNFLIVDGTGSALNATGSPYSSSVATGTGTGTLTVKNAATASFDNTLSVASTGTSATGTINVQSGATLIAADLDLASAATASSRATLNVTGGGSAVILNGSLIAGALSSTTVSSGASLVQGDFSTSPTGVAIGQANASLARGSSLVINGGFVALGSLVAPAGVVTLSSGALGFDGNLAVDPAGLLGYSVSLPAGTHLALTGSTTINVGSTLALTGGSLSTGSLASAGTLSFTAGTLAITGNNGLSVSSSGPLGATPNLSTGKNLIVSHTTNIASAASLAITGGSVTTDNLFNSGSLTVNNYGTLLVSTSLTNSPTGRLFLGPDLTATVEGPSSSAGRITLQGGATRLVGTSPLTNSGLITGDGELAKPLITTTTGELRAESGKALLVSGPALTNFGKLNLTGGTLEFSEVLTNSPTGQILGRGTLIASSGLSNNGQISFSGGPADVYGPLTNNNKILVTGTSTTTFYDPLENAAGADLFTAANSNSVFLAAVSGAGTFSGPGTKYFSDGSSTTSAFESGGITVVAETASLSLPDFAESAVTVNGQMTTTSPSKPSQTPSLTIGPSGTLDLTANSLLLTTPAQSPDSLSLSSFILQPSSLASTDTIRQYLSTGQLTSSRSDSTHALGYVPTATALLVKLSLLGDANLDGVLNADDFALTDKGFRTHASTWWLGDFNYDGAVTSADYLLLDSTYYRAHPLSPTAMAERESEFGPAYVASLLSAIPEPSSLAHLLFTAPLFRRRRKTL